MMVATNTLNALHADTPTKAPPLKGPPPPVKLRPAPTRTTPTRVTGGLVFTDPKLNAMREAAIKNDWDELFRIAPRGCLRAGDRGLTRADGSYGHCAEPEAYGGHDAPDFPQGWADHMYWRQNNPFRRQLSINDLRYKKDANGRVVKVPFTRAELEHYYRNYQLSRRQWYCGEGQLKRYIDTAYAGSHKVYPHALCDQTSSSRRRKIVKKVAVVAAAVTGAVLLGPAIVGKVGMALKSGAGAVGAAAKGAAGIVGGAGKIGALAAKTLPAATKILNGVATVRAIKKGQMPPAPISIGDGNFSDYANVVAEQLAQRELGKKLDEAQRAELAYMVEMERRRMAAVEPRHLPVVNSGLNPVLTESQKGRADAALSDSKVLKYAAIGLGIPLTLIAVRSFQK